MNFRQTDAKALSLNPFSCLDNDWALVTAGNAETGFNPMTVSWGGMGVIWGKNVATIYIRPQRYTYGLLEQNDRFTLSFFPPQQKKALQICGSKSGRDTDKIKETGLGLLPLENGTAAFEEANLILVCKKLYYSDIDPAQFLVPDLDEQNYPAKDYHRMYIAEIESVYVK